MEQDCRHLAERIARLEEQVKAAADALKIQAHALEMYKVTSNEWRGAISDQRTLFVTRAEVIAIVGLMLTVAGVVVGIVALIFRATPSIRP